jgi:hypothetical protein
VVVRALRSFELVVGTLGVTALLGGAAWPLAASAQRLEFGEEEELDLEPPDLSFVPPSRRPAPRYDLEEHLDRLSSPAPLAGSTARLLFTTRRGTRIYSESSLSLGLSAGLAPMPGTIDPRVSTQRYQLSRTLSTVNMPPMSMYPKGPSPAAHRQAVGRDLHPHLAHAAHARVAHGHVLGHRRGSCAGRGAVSGADHGGRPWPIWVMTWWVMWQCIAQSPGSSGTNSITRVLPTGTSTVVSGRCADSGT